MYYEQPDLQWEGFQQNLEGVGKDAELIIRYIFDQSTQKAIPFLR